MTLFWPLAATGAAVFICGFVGFMAGRLKIYQFDGYCALGNFAFVVANVTEHSSVGASISAATCAVSAYAWWKGGGGDDTKRRLKKLRRSFTGSRRTAPSTA